MRTCARWPSSRASGGRRWRYAATRPDAELPLPQGLPEALAVFPATVRAQQLAAAMAAARGIDPDAPAGLTKVTPTE